MRPIPWRACSILALALLAAFSAGCRKHDASGSPADPAATQASAGTTASQDAPLAPLLPLDEGNRWELRGRGAELVWESHRVGDAAAGRWAISSTLNVGGREEKTTFKLVEQGGWLWYEELAGPRGPLTPKHIGPEGGIRFLPTTADASPMSWSANFPDPATKPDDIVGYFALRTRRPLTTALGPTHVCLTTQEWNIGIADRAKKAGTSTLRFAEGVGLLSLRREIGEASGDAKPFDVRAVRVRLSGRVVDLTAPPSSAAVGESDPTAS